MSPRRSQRLSEKNKQIQNCSYKTLTTVNKPEKHSARANVSMKLAVSPDGSNQNEMYKSLRDEKSPRRSEKKASKPEVSKSDNIEPADNPTCYSLVLTENPPWRGSFIIYRGSNISTVGLEARLPKGAKSEVCELVNLLPTSMHLDMLPRVEIWPNSFNMQIPTDDDIQLLFCQDDFRADKIFAELLSMMCNQDLAMIATFYDVSLLVFPSHLLQPPISENILWAVLSQNLDSEMDQHDDHLPASEYSSEVAFRAPECPKETCVVQGTTDAVLDNVSEYQQHHLISNMPEGEKEGDGCHSPAATSGYSLGSSSVVHMLSSFDESTVLDEIDSASSVNGKVEEYSVKPEFVPVLRCIMDKHGDIAQHYQIKSEKLLTCALEEVCMVIIELQSIPFARLKKHHLSLLARAISIGEKLELNVKWLSKRYNDLTQTCILVKDYKRQKDTLKEGAKETEINRKAIQFKKAQVEMLQSEIKQLEDRVEVLEKECKTLKSTASNISVAFRELCHKYLMDGLF